MAIAHGNDAKYQETNTTCTVSHSLSAGSGNNRLVVVGGSQDDPTERTLTCTYNGVSMTPVDNAFVNGMTVRLFYILDANLPVSSGSYDIVLSTSSGADALTVIAAGFTGVSQEAFEDTNKATNINAYVISTTVNTVSAGSLVIGYSANADSTNTYASHSLSNYNVYTVSEGGIEHSAVLSWDVIAGGGATAVTNTSVKSWSQSIVAGSFKVSAAAPPGFTSDARIIYIARSDGTT